MVRNLVMSTVASTPRVSTLVAEMLMGWWTVSSLPMVSTTFPPAVQLSLMPSADRATTTATCCSAPEVYIAPVELMSEALPSAPQNCWPVEAADRWKSSDCPTPATFGFRNSMVLGETASEAKPAMAATAGVGANWLRVTEVAVALTTVNHQ